MHAHPLGSLARRSAALLLLPALALGGCAQATGEAPASPAAASDTASAAPVEQRVTVSAMGDMLPHAPVHAEARTADGYSYGQYFDAIRPRYADADLVFCNEEVLASATSVDQVKTYPRFRAPVQFADSLGREVGCNAINLANNHMADYEQSDIDRTRAEWDTLQPRLISGASRSAAEQQQIAVTEIDGIRVAQLSYTTQSNQGHTDFGLNMAGGPLMADQLARARQEADVVMVSMHWGTEDSTTPDDEQRRYVQQLSDAGVDVVIGTGPHVLQPAEYVTRADGRRMLVWYSIGNMLSTQMPVNNRTGVIARWSFVRDGDDAVRVEDATAIPTFMDFVSRGVSLANRHSLRILPMAEAGDRVAAEFPGETADSRFAFVTQTLGDQITVQR